MARLTDGHVASYIFISEEDTTNIVYYKKNYCSLVSIAIIKKERLRVLNYDDCDTYFDCRFLEFLSFYKISQTIKMLLF